MTNNSIIKPFLKWAGGKTQLLPELLSAIPTKFERYFEPFLGGGALFFAIQPKIAYLTDINVDLMTTYQVVRDYPRELIEDLWQHKYEKEYYYQIRNVDRTLEYKEWSNIQKASRFIYLNKTCFNGLYRVNRKGQFNVPMGRYKNPIIVNEDVIYSCSEALSEATLCHALFNEYGIWFDDPSNNFVYLDPPYVPLSDTSNFTQYTENEFTYTHQTKLKRLCDRLTSAGVKFLQSNSFTPLVFELYQNYNIKEVKASQAINSKGNSRGKISEVLITNY